MDNKSNICTKQLPICDNQPLVDVPPGIVDLSNITRIVAYTNQLTDGIPDGADKFINFTKLYFPNHLR